MLYYNFIIVVYSYLYIFYKNYLLNILNFYVSLYNYFFNLFIIVLSICLHAWLFNELKLSYLISLYIKILFLFDYIISEMLDSFNAFLCLGKYKNDNIALRYAVIGKALYTSFLNLLKNEEYYKL
jgi:hypothetical protein